MSIGIDIDTDFLIYPWITHNIDKELKDGEAIVGSHVIGEKGETVHFFNEELKIVGRLKQTGIGFDATVFVNQNTAKKLAKASERITANKVAEEDVISSVMIKAKPGVDSVKLASKISKELSKEGIFAMFSKKFVNSISSNLKVLSTSILVLVGAIWILSIVVLSISFTAIFNERKKEMAVLRVLGASKKRFIGKLLNDLPFDERVEGTVATTVIGIEKGVDIVRVHNVLENKRACLVADGIYRKRG